MSFGLSSELAPSRTGAGWSHLDPLRFGQLVILLISESRREVLIWSCFSAVGAGVPFSELKQRSCSRHLFLFCPSLYLILCKRTGLQLQMFRLSTEGQLPQGHWGQSFPILKESKLILNQCKQNVKWHRARLSPAVPKLSHITVRDLKTSAKQLVNKPEWVTHTHKIK